ncbi:caspase-3-like isoform X1 [Acropora palmata]|uniref:caspase-3-like isoform X1 n=1 Tax=Acropora palmata TaxID=6131 RepID=UPI003DA08FE0
MAANSSYAVVISRAEAHYEGHTSVVNCLKCTYHADDIFRPYGVPFRLNDEKDRFIFLNSFLREQKIKEGTVIKTFSGCNFSKNTGFQLEVSEIIRHLKFNDNEGVVVFRGIANAFPKATIQEKGIIQNDRPHPFHHYALISVLSAITQDGRIIVLTSLGEQVNLSNRSVTCYKKNIETVEVPIRQPVSGEDVGDVILIALGSKPTKEGYYIGVCEGILLSASSSDEDNPSPISEPECYKIDSKPKGLCLLINNMTFKEENLNRHDAIYDEERLHNLFAGKLDFEVHPFNDLDNCQMQAICTEFGGKDHRQYDAFVCIIMSHGTCGDKIKGVNGRTIGIDDLMSEFNIERCPSLANKPKLFLVQACRGLAEDRFLCPTDKSQDIVDFTVSDSTLSRSICPQESDFLLAFSTVPGYVSYRRPNFGSFFMQAVADVFEKDHDKDHVLDMLMKVNREVSTASNQVPAIHSTLRFKVYL